MNITTPDDRKAFSGYLREWQVKLGLGTWRITLSPKPAKNCLAQVYEFDREQRQARVKLGERWFATPVTPGTLEQTAVHELLHILLYELIEAAKNPHISQEDLANAEHAVVNALEKALVHCADE